VGRETQAVNDLATFNRPSGTKRTEQFHFVSEP